MKKQEVIKNKEIIDNMDHLSMAKLWRFASLGHEYFINKELSDHFAKKFKEKGGMTPEISKYIGWYIK